MINKKRMMHATTTTTPRTGELYVWPRMISGAMNEGVPAMPRLLASARSLKAKLKSTGERRGGQSGFKNFSFSEKSTHTELHFTLSRHHDVGGLVYDGMRNKLKRYTDSHLHISMDVS